MAEPDIKALKVAIAQIALPGNAGERAGAVVRAQLALVEAALAERGALLKRVGTGRAAAARADAPAKSCEAPPPLPVLDPQEASPLYREGGCCDGLG